ncbi:MAG: hypothetical protein WCF85_16300 [Rhodospirillaceae bacterium]
MPIAAIDTLKVSHKLQSAGMPRKQAEAVAEAMAETVEDRAGKDAVKEAVETLGRAVDKRFTALESKVDHQGAAIQRLEQGQTELRTEMNERLSGIESLLSKILDGQAVLHQNDMELKRRLDERKP